MRTRDGGRTWEKLNTRTSLYIFALSFPDRLHGFMVGENGLVLSTTDGGESFFKRQLQHIFPPELKDYTEKLRRAAVLWRHLPGQQPGMGGRGTGTHLDDR